MFPRKFEHWSLDFDPIGDLVLELKFRMYWSLNLSQYRAMIFWDQISVTNTSIGSNIMDQCFNFLFYFGIKFGDDSNVNSYNLLCVILFKYLLISFQLALLEYKYGRDAKSCRRTSIWPCSVYMFVYLSVYLCVTLIYYCCQVTKYQITDLFSGIILFMKDKTTIINGPTYIIRLIFLEMTYCFLHQTYSRPLS